MKHECRWHNQWLGGWLVGVRGCYCAQDQEISEALKETNSRLAAYNELLAKQEGVGLFNDTVKLKLEVARWFADHGYADEARLSAHLHEQKLQQDSRKVQLLLGFILFFTLAAIVADILFKLPASEPTSIEGPCFFSYCRI